MVDPRQSLEFERPLVELENKIAELKQLAGGELLAAEIKILERRASRVRAEIYSNLSPWQKVQLSRHPLRPYTLDYVSKLCSEFSSCMAIARFPMTKRWSVVWLV